MLNHWIFLKRWLLVEKNSLFSVDDALGLKLLTFLRLVFCHLKEHKFRDGFKDTLNSLCFCGAKVETTVHFLSHCQLYSTQRSELFDNIGKLINSFLNVNKKPQALVLLCGLKRNNSENLNQNTEKLLNYKKYDLLWIIVSITTKVRPNVLLSTFLSNYDRD